jgi:flagellar basal-body rod protein FlgC
MSAERYRMEIIAANLANAHATRSANGQPFRRQDVILEAVGATSSGGTPGVMGVRVAEVVEDPSPFQRVYMPSHPDADGEGFVEYPNVQLPVEMVNLLTAMRSYEANLKAAQAFRQISEQTLLLLRGGL